jgi:hypothetical protein
VGETFEFGQKIKDHKECEKLKFWKKANKKFYSMKPIVNDKLKENLNLLESARVVYIIIDWNGAPNASKYEWGPKTKRDK